MNIITNDTALCEEAIAALREVIDPEIGLNIVDLGLIYQLDFDAPNSNIYVFMTLTTQFCPMGASIVNGVKEALQTAFPGYEAAVALTFDPPWRPQRISAEGQKFLNR